MQGHEKGKIKVNSHLWWKWKSISHVQLFSTLWVPFPFSRGSSQPRDQIQVSYIAGRFFTSWAPRETQEHWSGSLSLLHAIVPTQESNQGLLHCRLILCQLNYQGSPLIPGKAYNSKICRSDYVKRSEQKYILKGAAKCQRITMIMSFIIWYTKAL